MFMFLPHQEQTEGKESDVHQTDSVCDWGACPSAGRWAGYNKIFIIDYSRPATWVEGEIGGQGTYDVNVVPAGKVGQNPQSQTTQTGQ